MNIEKLKITGFGKFRDISFSFSNGFNFIYGENEAGKSTIQAFILGILFGLKNGRGTKDNFDISFKKYAPLSGGSYGGFMEYKLDTGDLIRVERDFDKNILTVFDSDFNDITHTFEISREKGVLFARKHIGMDKDSFIKTVFINQIPTARYSSENKELGELLTNLAQTGYESVSYIKASAALKDALIKFVGSDKTKNRPLEVMNHKLKQLINKKEELLKEKEYISYLEAEIKKCKEIEEGLCIKEQFLKEAKEIIDLRKSINEKISIQKELTKISQELSLVPRLVLFIISIFKWIIKVFTLQKRTKKNNQYNIFNRKKYLSERFAQISSDIKACENIIENKLEFLRGLNLPAESIDILIDGLFIENIKEAENFVHNQTEALYKALSSNKIQMMNLNTQVNNTNIIDELEKNEEVISETKQKIKNIENMGKSLKMALEVLDESKTELQSSFSQYINKRINEVVGEISSEKYNDIRIDNSFALKVLEPEWNKVIPVSMLSLGTMELMYFAQRIAVADMFIKETNEKLPFILDEVLSQYDDKRAKNMLMYFYSHFNDRQILFFSCKSRELNIAREIFGEKLNIIYL